MRGLSPLTTAPIMTLTKWLAVLMVRSSHGNQEEESADKEGRLHFRSPSNNE